MKKINLSTLASLFLAFATLFVMNACSHEEPIIQPVEDQTLHTTTMELNLSRPQFEPTTRSAAAWEEGDAVYLLFNREGGTTSGVAVYNATEQTWTVNYYGSLDRDKQGVVRATYFDKAANTSTTDVTLSASTGIYQDSLATYVYPTDGKLTVTGALTPINNRIRFKGQAGTTVQVGGLTTHASYNIKGATLTTTTNSISVTVQSDGYTPYIYGTFTESTRLLTVKNGEDTFALNCPGNVLPDAQAGQSGWMDLPTITAYNGWRIAVTGVTLDKTEATLSINETLSLKVTFTPSNATNQDVTWTSANENVATVSNTGVVTAKADGATTITATSQDNPQVKATCTVLIGNPVFTANGVRFTMIAVEAGTFTMGATSEQENPYDNEKPTHQVTLTKNYFIGQTEVTQALWKAVTGSSKNWSSTYGVGDNYPAYYVTWNECQTFITQLNALTGKTFRLPTEAEWEFAARGGNKSNHTQYSGSATIEDVAWYTSNSSSTTHTVATKAPNELGIYDMSGNVWEWCQDWYGSYSSDAQTDPTGPTSGSSRVLRGGSWSTYARDCRTAYRYDLTPGNSYCDLGLRLVLSE